MKFLDVDAIELDENGKPQLETVINELKESASSFGNADSVILNIKEISRKN